MWRQNPESATGRPTSKIRVFWGILDAAAESRVRAGGSNIQNPRLLGEFGCCGRIQSPGHRIQDTDFSRIHGFSKSNIRVSNFKIPPCSLSSRSGMAYWKEMALARRPKVVQII